MSFGCRVAVHVDSLRRTPGGGRRCSSISSVGDSFDTALAETVNGYYKAESIRGPARSGPWKSVKDVELATLGWVHWHNTSRLHGYLNDLPPIEYEKNFYAAHQDDQVLAYIKTPEPPSDPERFSTVAGGGCLHAVIRSS